ncbi:hypothetical protein Lfee_1979 [Legionella feeleii]|uniref:Uncharacterized protein n=2 Tax=Legionella feeleii TaxID=453 RepID=A0A0W0TLX2_9GAMM|nr:hypothetical protein Lfee_1979 [Legionella feeleii]SPX61439.1 Uncharacterised protein [Legionella feeleii]
MTLIVNLSSIHSLYPISTSVRAFAQLCNNYSTGCLTCCPSFFQSGTNFAWVMYQYHTQYKALIEPYKLGKITSRQFLANLLTIFDFLDDDDFVCNMSDSVKIAGCSYKEANLALLENAWNAIIGLEDDRVARFATLAERAAEEPVYLISNTNELNVNKIIQLLQSKNPEIHFYPIDLDVVDDKRPIEIAPNIFLCLSYRYQLFKTDSQNRAATNSNSTMSLLRYLVEEQLPVSNRESIHVISQYPADLEEAIKLGIAPANTHQDSNYFPAPTLTTLEID